MNDKDTKMSHHAIGIDLGGTNARCAIVNDSHQVIARSRSTTPVKDGFEAVMNTLATLVAQTIKDANMQPEDFRGLCAACPGPLDGHEGVVLEAPNLRWRNAPVAKTLSKLTGLHCLIENDANAAGFGEFCSGAGKGCNSMVMMTLGTGVGGAIIIDGVLRRGPDWTAAELGHLVIQDGGRQCGCGQRGCIEAYSSATATVNRFREGLAIGWTSSLGERDPETLTCADIFTAAQQGDDLARHTVEGTARYIAIMAANMANLLNPDRMIISGGMIQAGDFLFDMIRKEYQRRPFEAPVKRMKILPAMLGEDAGVIGAAECVFQALQR